MKKVCVIGAGGIGSFLARTADDLLEHRQLIDCKLDWYDNDIVENKNIKYQDFDPEDIDENKVEALSYKYTNIYSFNTERVGKDIMQKYDLIVLCADNSIVRKDAYDNYKELGIPFIDARSNGSAVGIYSSDTENYLDTIDLEDTGSHSCQYKYQLDNNEIELGNRIVAQILAQTILTYFRKNRLPFDYKHMF